MSLAHFTYYVRQEAFNGLLYRYVRCIIRVIRHWTSPSSGLIARDDTREPGESQEGRGGEFRVWMFDRH
jgi:hypothetical protein